MADTYAVLALRRKRSRLARQIEMAELALARQREDLATLDAVICMFEPDGDPELIRSIRPRSRRNPFFRHGELPRLCADVLRGEGKPLSARDIAQCLMDLKGIEVDAHTRRQLTEHVRLSLHRLAEKGSVRKIIKGPETWWELGSSSTQTTC